ncbi:Multidrug transporter EmrE [Arthrobacter crystallopoietes]|uniref:Multidrug transporter EmrE n=1 Tax=Crystallibacter crystallopoietes TaxID=37928 RepID=A0A1H0ZL67_9MICC|nr:Multidrug transporter EmrE [Arthrobacter crystallopoietes]
MVTPGNSFERVCWMGITIVAPGPPGSKGECAEACPNCRPCVWYVSGVATTPRKGALLLAGAIITEVAGSLSLKGALTTPLLYAVVVVGYVAAFVLLAAVLRTGMAIGVAYGIWGATGVALTAVMSLIIFGEPLTLLMGIGILVIIAGVLCVELGSQAAHRGPAEVNSEVA